MSGNHPSNSTSLDLVSLSKKSCKCSSNRKPGRNLVVFIDGTSNTIVDNTHVFELYDNIVKDDKKQLACYASGVGTHVNPEGFAQTELVEQVSRVWDLAIAQRNIVNAYGWLSDRYHDGDKIFLFGFSRGAYQVRALAGMIHEVGLIRRANKKKIPYAFQYYSAINSGKFKDIQLAKDFKIANSRSVGIHFIGVWDTVSSVGVNRTNNLPSTDTCDHICYFRHALALDECRVKFQPEFVYGGMNERSNWFKYQSVPSPTDEDRVKEVWFAGSHSDVGGASWKKTSHPNDLRNMPLLWMREEAHEAGLLLRPREAAFRYGYEESQQRETANSLTLVWWLLEVLPIGTSSLQLQHHKALPHLGRGRIIMPGQKIHESVLFRPNYRPKAVFWRNTQQWPEAAYCHASSPEERLSQLGSALEPLPSKGSTAGVSNRHIPDSLALMCLRELNVKAVKKMNVRETPEVILSIDDRPIDGAEPARDEEGSLPADPEKNGDPDIAKEEPDIRLLRLSAFVAHCEFVENGASSRNAY
ncbi:hypothetical protein DFH29DRAFT_993594 [Suillus ampliporus]|nr:hypothetical protein DFH29DRAFT_993594 [Suillus ampliporus]